MVGSALACGLAQQSLRVALVDKTLPTPIEPNEPPRIRVSALHLASEQLLRNLGAWHHIAAQRTFAYQYLAVKEMPDKKSGFLPPLPDISNWATTRFEASQLDRPYLGHIVENDVIQLGLIERVCELPISITTCALLSLPVVSNFRRSWSLAQTARNRRCAV